MTDDDCGDEQLANELAAVDAAVPPPPGNRVFTPAQLAELARHRNRRAGLLAAAAVAASALLCWQPWLPTSDRDPPDLAPTPQVVSADQQRLNRATARQLAGRIDRLLANLSDANAEQRRRAMHAHRRAAARTALSNRGGTRRQPHHHAEPTHRKTMNAIAIRAPLFAALMCWCEPTVGQDLGQPKTINSVLIVQSGPNDIVLNKHLLDALLAEPELETELRRTFDQRLLGIDQIWAGLPAPHAAGTFQVHLNAELLVDGEWTRKEQDAATQAMVKHLMQRLDNLLFVQPAKRLRNRKDQLQQRFRELSHERIALQHKHRQLERRVADLEQQSAQATDRLRQARVVAMTERGEQQSIKSLRARYDSERHNRQDKLRRLRLTQARLEGELKQARARLSTLNFMTEAQRSKLEAELLAECQHVESSLEETQVSLQFAEQELAELQGQLAVTLERLPPSVLAAQRAELEQQTLARDYDKLALELEQSRQDLLDVKAGGVAVEQLDIDISVCRSLLIEVQGRLERLVPVHYELLRSR